MRESTIDLRRRSITQVSYPKTRAGSAQLATEAAAALRALAAGRVSHIILASGALAKLIGKLDSGEESKLERAVSALAIMAGASEVLAAKMKVCGASGASEVQLWWWKKPNTPPHQNKIGSTQSGAREARYSCGAVARHTYTTQRIMLTEHEGKRRPKGHSGR